MKHPMQQDEDYVVISYKNYRGEQSERVIEPIRIYFGSTEYHPQPQWLLCALDFSRNDSRTFAIQDISSWQPYPEWLKNNPQ